MDNKKLGLFIITYNRAELLARTLDFLASSVLKSYPITILDNASTDDTVVVATSKRDILSGLQIISNHVNVGPNANFLKAFDYSNFDYTWVICDDDVFDLSCFDDVLTVIEKGDVELIHVGAHKQNVWKNSGAYKTPKQLLATGYAYFKFASFMPCNIFKTSTFVDSYIVQGYNNVGNSYPHMPFAFGMYLKDVVVYISNQQIVFAQEGQSYPQNAWYLWWMKTCEILVNPSEVRNAYLNQWKDNGIVSDEQGLRSILYAQSLMRDSVYIKEFVSKYLTLQDKIKLFAYQLNIKDIRNNFYWFRKRLKNKYNYVMYK